MGPCTGPWACEPREGGHDRPSPAGPSGLRPRLLRPPLEPEPSRVGPRLRRLPLRGPHRPALGPPHPKPSPTPGPFGHGPPPPGGLRLGQARAREPRGLPPLPLGAFRGVRGWHRRQPGPGRALCPLRAGAFRLGPWGVVQTFRGEAQTATGVLALGLFYASSLNLVLAVFNLLPIPLWTVPRSCKASCPSPGSPSFGGWSSTPGSPSSSSSPCSGGPSRRCWPSPGGSSSACFSARMAPCAP